MSKFPKNFSLLKNLPVTGKKYIVIFFTYIISTEYLKSQHIFVNYFTFYKLMDERLMGM